MFIFLEGYGIYGYFRLTFHNLRGQSINDPFGGEKNRKIASYIPNSPSGSTKFQDVFLKQSQQNKTREQQ